MDSTGSGPASAPSNRRMPAIATSSSRAGSLESSLRGCNRPSADRPMTSVKVPPRSIQKRQRALTPKAPRRHGTANSSALCPSSRAPRQPPPPAISGSRRQAPLIRFSSAGLAPMVPDPPGFFRPVHRLIVVNMIERSGQARIDEHGEASAAAPGIHSLLFGSSAYSHASRMANIFGGGGDSPPKPFEIQIRIPWPPPFPGLPHTHSAASRQRRPPPGTRPNHA